MALTVEQRQDVMIQFMAEESATRTSIAGGKAALLVVVNGLDDALDSYISGAGRGDLTEAQALAVVRSIVDSRLGG
jgi:hypothetical protein